jgi:capsule polysaccharide export protein KpsE/RkpR
MGQYANTVNAFAMSAARAQVYTQQNTMQSYGQTAQQLNVSTAKFRRDIEAKKAKFIAKLEKERVVKLQQELAHLQAKHSIA